MNKKQIMKYKYIMFDGDGIKLPVIFPEVFVHRHIAGSLMPQMRQIFTESKVVSAGFYDFTHNKCYGESESLKLESDPKDAQIISGILGDVNETR